MAKEEFDLNEYVQAYKEYDKITGRIYLSYVKQELSAEKWAEVCKLFSKQGVDCNKILKEEFEEEKE